MNIYDKLLAKVDEIKQQPEHVRVRYVWICTAISMVLVFVVWFLSFKSASLNFENPKLTQEQIQILNNMANQKKGIQDATDQMKKSLEAQQAQKMQQNQDQTIRDNIQNQNKSQYTEGFNQ